MDELRSVAKRIRYATMLTKIAPFVCALVYVVCILAYLIMTDTALFIVDTLFYVSPLTVLLIYAFGVVFKCCKWHKLQCALLLLPTIISLVDGLIYELSAVATWINWAVTAVIIGGSLHNAYRIFWDNGKADE